MTMEKPKISKQELKGIMDDYKPNTDKDDDYILLIKEAIQSLNESDKIIFLLYTEFASEQKLADLLNVSRTPIHSLIVKCRQKINDYIKNKQ